MTPDLLTHRTYVEQQDNAYYIVGKRVSLDSIIYAFLAGQSPESIQQSFPTVTLEEVYGAIAFYLANRSIIDHYLAEGEVQFEQLRKQAQETNALLYRKLHNNSVGA